MRELAGKTAFVTGAASGIGFGVARALVDAGSKVMLADIEEAALANAVDDLRRVGGDVAGVILDVSVKAEIQTAADATVARFGKINILVNNAGVIGNQFYGSWTDAGWDWILGVNLMSVIWGFEIFAPLMTAHGERGHIVSTSSVQGLVTGRNPAYDASKYAVIALSENLRNTLAPMGIDVSVLCPGPIRTRIMDAERNLPERLAGKVELFPDAGPVAEANARSRDILAAGIDPVYVGELVCQGIVENWPYIFTDTESEAAIDARFRAIKAGFDAIRHREPRR